ncbi:hypothetical protein [Streptomyces rimosus]|uniref:hypothetical protein n=1 Tax=Streptomyces rimosus TaxID=1927 RepID=UPI00131B7822|nr:hypothetical protein [Streptomyces rimosus]
MVLSPNGALSVFARDPEGRVTHTWQRGPEHHRWQTGTGGPWSAWTPLHGHLTTDPAVVLNPHGTLSAFGRGPDGRVTHTWQRGPEQGYAWNDTWADMEGDLADDPPEAEIASPAFSSPASA